MRALPQPDAAGIYTFPTDLAEAHFQWQQELGKRKGETTILDIPAPLTGTPYLIEQRRPTGRPVVVIEPHHDDFALSAAGLFLARPRPVTVITVFTRSASIDPAFAGAFPTVEAVSALRAAEGAAALEVFGARRYLLGHSDAARPYRADDKQRLDEITHEIATVLADHGDAELLAPAAVTRHPDHLLVHEAARRLGCRWFWEDVAFWSTYALAGCDQHLFRARVGSSMTPELSDITDDLLDKLTLLHLHGSQKHPASKRFKPLRHAWTVAADLVDQPQGPRFAERFYRLETP